MHIIEFFNKLYGGQCKSYFGQAHDGSGRGCHSLLEGIVAVTILPWVTLDEDLDHAWIGQRQTLQCRHLLENGALGPRFVRHGFTSCLAVPLHRLYLALSACVVVSSVCAGLYGRSLYMKRVASIFGYRVSIAWTASPLR